MYGDLTAVGGATVGTPVAVLGIRQLALTGSAIWMLALVACLLLLAGSGLVLRSRKLRTVEPTTGPGRRENGDTAPRDHVGGKRT